MSTQVLPLPQTVSAVSVQTGEPPTHTAPSPIPLPHAPQWFDDVAMSVQAPLQRTQPLGQEAPPTQVLPLQVCPWPQVKPHPPQFSASVESETHRVPQRVSEEAQAAFFLRFFLPCTDGPRWRLAAASSEPMKPVRMSPNMPPTTPRTVVRRSATSDRSVMSNLSGSTVVSFRGRGAR